MAKFKSAKELGITEGERKWLIETAKVLKNVKPRKYAPINGFDLKFDMSTIAEDDDDHFCGAVGCIKGWMGFLAFHAGEGESVGIRRGATRGKLIEAVEASRNSRALDALFYPEPVDYLSVTPAIAVKAITSFLTTGDPCFLKHGAKRDRDYTE